MDSNQARFILEEANILRLVPAARQAGLQFRNGLKKNEIINLLLSQGIAVKAAEEVMRQSVPHPIPKPNHDWIIMDEASEVKPLEPKVSPPMSQPAPTSQEDILTQAIKAIAAQVTPKGSAPLDESRVAEIATNVFDENTAYFRGQLAKQIEEAIAKLPQGTTIHLPPKTEPIYLPERQHVQFPDLLLFLQQGLNVFLVGGAGTGKTHASQKAAEALGKQFYAQGAVTYAHELLGYIDAHSKYVRTQFREAFENGGVILLDEFDASSPEAALTVNAALANSFCSFPDGVIQKHPEFLCIVGANTDGSGATMQYSGRARLDGAFLDRFVMLEWHLDPKIEKEKAKGKDLWLSAVKAIRAWMTQRGILDVAATVRAVDYGSTLLHAGYPPEKVLSVCLKRGALAKEWKSIQSLPAVTEFLTGF